MGLTERHWFEDEEPELTENQLEDILWENNKIFERGYQKGFSDGKSALLLEQEPVKPISHADMMFCGNCRYAIPRTVNYCPKCGKKVKWNDAE